MYIYSIYEYDFWGNDNCILEFIKIIEIDIYV